MVEVLARRTVTTAGEEVVVEVVSTGNGVMLRVKDCPLVHLTLAEAHKMLSRLGRASAEGEGVTEKGARAAAVWGELV